ncbi:DUF1302 domain-containing protein [Pseudomonas sp. N040]|nr:DUF1302 domain-containing protein [Pseudomonas sp. N040]MBF7731384.1 DUF1302 domain-containing protein [Pseudomonas sp. N040]MBW7015027.1 DUF1302 domain-containing protein [Pseudomonas sp. N040]
MKSPHHRPLHRSLLATAILAASLPSAHAFEFDTGSEDWAARLDNTLKYNYGVRTESADSRILGTPNSNDGDYNFRKAGTNITNRVDLLTEMDVVFKSSMGFRVSAASWYDKAYENTGSNANPMVNGNGAQSGYITQALGPANAAAGGFGSRHLSNYAQRYYNGPSGEILDAFLFYNTEIGDNSLLGVKAGQHNVFWGETFLSAAHSLSYGQAGLDLAKAAASPGTEAKELFLPRNQISATFNLNPELTFGAQYFLDWDPARLPEAGTYYAGSDVVGQGAQSLLLGNGYVPVILPSINPNAVADVSKQITLRRGDDYTPDDRGDWGVMAKWSPEWLDGTLGFYYRQTSDIMPQATLDTRLPLISFPPPVFDRQYLQYQFAYNDNIDIYGLSLSKEFGGVSVGSDLNYRENMTLTSIAANYNPTTYAALQAAGINPGSAGVVDTAPEDGDSMAATGKTLHWTLNGLVAIADTPLFDSASLLGELYYSNLLSLDSKNEALYKGKDTYRGVDKATRDNVGIAVNFTPTWFQVLPGVDMNMPLTVNYGIDGNSPVAGGGAEDTGNYSLGVGAIIRNQYFVDLKYVDAFGKAGKCDDPVNDNAQALPVAGTASVAYTCYAGGYSSFSGSGATEDRGAVYLTLKTTF